MRKLIFIIAIIAIGCGGPVRTKGFSTSPAAEKPRDKADGLADSPKVVPPLPDR